MQKKAEPNGSAFQIRSCSPGKLTELMHGIYRAQTNERRLLREAFIEELVRDLTVYPYTSETAMLAGRIDGERQAQGVTIPFADLLIGATALSLGSPC